MSDFETILKKVSFTLEEDRTIVEIDYSIIENGSPYTQNFVRSRAFPVERDVVSIIQNELHTLEFLKWCGIRSKK